MFLTKNMTSLFVLLLIIQTLSSFFPNKRFEYFFQIRIREPLVEKKPSIVQEKWLVIDEFVLARKQQPGRSNQGCVYGYIPLISSSSRMFYFYS